MTDNNKIASTPGAEHHRYSFGQFTLDVERGALLKDGVEVPLRPKGYLVLTYLIEHHGVLLTRDKLLAEVWPGLVVTEDSLTQCLIQIRKALGDTKKEMIRTIPRRGFIFDAPVTVHPHAENSESTTVRQGWQENRKPSRWSMAAAALLTLAIATSWWSLNSRQASNLLHNAQALPNSIAVLPFVNMSDDGANEYFADGLSEELLNLLTKIPELQVTAHASSFSFKGKDIDIPTIAQRLNVAHILEGSVRKSGEQVRITAQLIKARSGTHLWSQTYDRALDNIFTIQDEIATEVVAQLKVRLLGAEPTVPQTDSLAYTLFLRARYISNQGTPQAWEQALEMYQQSLEIAPGYAPAWAGLATMYALQRYTGNQPFPETFALARDAAKRAVEIDPTHAPGHAMLGEIAMIHDRDLAAAARHLAQALELEPANPFVLHDASDLTMILGRMANTIEVLEYLVARDPVNPYFYFSLGWANLHARQSDEAIAALDVALKLNPGGLGGPFTRGLALLQKGQAEAALVALEPFTSESMRLIGEALAYHALGRQAESDIALAELIEKHQENTAYNIAYVMAYRGEADRAFEWLDKAIEYNDSGLSRIAVTPWFDNIHDDPRWPLLLESMGKSPEQLAAIEFKVTLP